DGARAGHAGPLRRVRDLAGQPEAGRPARADQHPQAPLPALAGERAVKPSRWEKFRRYFAAQYLTVDARSLGLGRIVLSLILLIDLLRRIPDLTLFYSNQGLIPNHMMLWRPPTQWMFSFFFVLSHPDEVAVGFAVCGLVYLLLMLGWHTRLMHFLALIC